MHAKATHLALWAAGCLLSVFALLPEFEPSCSCRVSLLRWLCHRSTGCKLQFFSPHSSVDFGQSLSHLDRQSEVWFVYLVRVTIARLRVIFGVRFHSKRKQLRLSLCVHHTLIFTLCTQQSKSSWRIARLPPSFGCRPLPPLHRDLPSCWIPETGHQPCTCFS